MFNALIDWVENGIAPDSITAYTGQAIPWTTTHADLRLSQLYFVQRYRPDHIGQQLLLRADVG